MYKESPLGLDGFVIKYLDRVNVAFSLTLR